MSNAQDGLEKRRTDALAAAGRDSNDAEIEAWRTLAEYALGVLEGAGIYKPRDESVEHSTCEHCDRYIEEVEGRWVDPYATGDDSVWRETCDANDTFEADHEPRW